MERAKPLPAYLIKRYHGWKATSYAENKAWYRRLAEDGQHPRAMVISCCDSRVHVTSIFGADQGEFFIHRNIANLVPPYSPDGDLHGTSAAVEYAVAILKVSHVIVLGHSNCGGVNSFHESCTQPTPKLADDTTFVDRWMSLLQPAYDRISDITDMAAQRRALEREAVLVSLENLMTFPFIQNAVSYEMLTLHGLWTDIGEGGLEQYDPARGEFAAL